MARSAFELDLGIGGLDGMGAGGMSVRAAARAEPEHVRSISASEAGAAEVATLYVNHYSWDGHDGNHDHGMNCDCEACAAAANDNDVAADEFQFGSALAPANAPDIPNSANITLEQLMKLIQFLRDRMDDDFPDYTSGLGENGVVSDYNITITFDGDGWTQNLYDRFVQAAEYWSTIITGDQADVGDIDDIEIAASIVDIDGSGGVLGQAGPTYIRNSNGLTTEGIMEFDVADAEDFDDMGLFVDIVVHEMGHVLGIGTLWDYLGLTTGSVQSGDYRFTGENAILAYETEFADIANADPDSDVGVPIETDGGSGTAGGHWDDETFENELMTGYIDDDNFVSSMTVASLEDLGYETIWDASDPTAEIPQIDDIVIV